MSRTIVAGSQESLRLWLSGATDWSDLAVVILPTAAAFMQPTEAAVSVGLLFEAVGARVEVLMLTQRGEADNPDMAQRIAAADWVVLLDGSPLHAAAVWRGTLVGEALSQAHAIIALGATATVLGSTMIDPRGGAPTKGLGYRPALLVSTELPEEMMTRLTSLLSPATLRTLAATDLFEVED
jgi:cyanophycinase-like exopeptidase